MSFFIACDAADCEVSEKFEGDVYPNTTPSGWILVSGHRSSPQDNPAEAFASVFDDSRLPDHLQGVGEAFAKMAPLIRGAIPTMIKEPFQFHFCTECSKKLPSVRVRVKK